MIFCFVKEKEIFYIKFLLFDVGLVGIIWYLDLIIFCIRLGFGYKLYFFVNDDVFGG